MTLNMRTMQDKKGMSIFIQMAILFLIIILLLVAIIILMTLSEEQSKKQYAKNSCKPECSSLGYEFYKVEDKGFGGMYCWCLDEEGKPINMG